MTDHQSLGVNKRCFAALLTDGIIDVKPVEATKQSRALNNDFRWCTIYDIQMLLSRKMQKHFTSQTAHQRNWHDRLNECETALTWIYIFRLVMMNMRAFPMRAPSSNRDAPLHTSQPPSRHWDGLHGQAPESCDRKVCRARTAGHRLIDDPHPLWSASRRWFNDTILEGGEGPEHQENTVTLLVRMACYQLDNMMPCCFSRGAVADAEWISSLSCKKMHTMIFCRKHWWASATVHERKRQVKIWGISGCEQNHWIPA